MSRRRKIALAATVAVLFPGFLVLGWWQLDRALSGNTLSWVYTFEWPLFAVYLVYVWRRLLRDEHRPDELTTSDAAEGAGRAAPSRQEAGDGEEDEELAAYNEYLAALQESGRRKHW